MCARTQFMTGSFLWAERPIMSKTNETMKHNAEATQFRFALIAPVIQGLFPDASATAYYKRVIAAPLTLPDGTSVKYSYKTLENFSSLPIISAICASMDEEIYVFSNSIILFSFPILLFYNFQI